MTWTLRNLATQGYCLTQGDATRLRVGLRFSTGLCLPLVAAALALESAPMLFALAAIALVAGFGSHHPFDLLWNRAVRHLWHAPPLPGSPRRRRHAFKLGVVLLLGAGALLATGRTGPALALGAGMLVSCTLVTATNLCIPSTILRALESLRRPKENR